jgi:predicted N-acetyltransferase YhbS
LAGVTISIELLAEHPGTIRELGRWMHEAWPAPGHSAADRAATYLLCMNRDRVPLTLVAMASGQVVGTVSLLQHSVASHDHLTPWVAALYVHRDWRHAGLGTALVHAAAGRAQRLGVRRVYIGVACAARAHYEKQGWQHVGAGQVDEDPLDCVDVLQQRLDGAGSA